jgi:hypothetical protein
MNLDVIRMRIDRDFTYHPLDDDQVERYEKVLAKCQELAHLIVDMTLSSREQSLALTSLENVASSVHDAIARNG